MTSSGRSDAAVAAFARLTQAPPAGVWSAPGRVTLVGDHTDYSGGWVLPLAIGRQALVAAGLRVDGRVRVASLQLAGVVEMPLSAIQPGQVEGWARYPMGTVWALREAGLALGGLDLVVDSDIPGGAGMASSAALEVATALAVTELTGQSMSAVELARCCQDGENAVAGAPTGVMDQVAALEGRVDHALLLDCRSLVTEQVAWRPWESSLALLAIDTSVRHANSGTEYRSRREQCAAAAAALGLDCLRDATAVAAGALSGVLARRARHVITENGRVLEMAALLRAGRIADTGQVMDASHASLRDDFEVSCAELDLAVETARRAGAVGARMTGAGFGGCAIALVPVEAIDAVSTAVQRTFADHGHRPPHVAPVVSAGGAHRLS